MICEQCGTGVPAGPGFCPECGSAVKAPGPEATFKFACPHCRQRIRVPRSWGGNRGHCPACRCSLVIPAPEPELALHPAPPAACAVPLPEPALRPIPAERPIQRDVSAGENGEPEAPAAEESVTAIARLYAFGENSRSVAGSADCRDRRRGGSDSGCRRFLVLPVPVNRVSAGRPEYGVALPFLC